MAPRVFIIRHGETEWSLNGRHTGTTDLPLTENGEKRVRATGRALVGDDRLIQPQKIAHIYVSPRTRAQKTLELLELGCHDRLPWSEKEPEKKSVKPIVEKAKVQITDDIQEWNYGEYEGVTSKKIKEIREQKGEKVPWDIWTDGCPGGESPQEVTKRLDQLIAEIRSKYHQPALENNSDRGDVLIVAHGHILRAFAMRWIGKELTSGVSLILEAGGVGTLSYEHSNIKEPAILLGGAFMSDLAQP